MNKAQELKSLLAHPGWKHVIEYIVSTQSIKFNEISKQGASSEDILKSVGAIDTLRRLMGWVEQSSQQKDSEV